MNRPPGHVTPDDLMDDLIALALGGLSPTEEARVRAAVEADPALLAEWQETLEALGPLLSGLDLSAPPPPDAGERLLGRLALDGAEGDAANEAPPASLRLPAAPRRWGWGPLTLGSLALAGALALLLALGPWRPFGPPTDPLERYAAQPGAVSRTVARGGAAIATLVRLPDGRVFVRAQAPPAAGQVYQLWRVPPGEGSRPVSLGVLRGQDLLTGPLPAGLTLALSVEPPGGSSQPTTTPLFAERI